MDCEQKKPSSAFQSKDKNIEQHSFVGPPLIGLFFMGVMTPRAFGQPGAIRSAFGGLRAPSDAARLNEMMLDRLALDVSLDKSQRKLMQDVIDKAQNAAKPLEDAFQVTLSSIKEAVQSSKQQGVIDTLNQQLGATYSMLTAVQSAAFADAMKILKDEQKHHAARVYDTLGIVRISGERPGRLRGGLEGVV